MGVYVDRNGDGVITDQDRYFYKSTTSPWTAGLSTRLQYKNWDFGMNFRGSFGGYVYNELEAGMANIGQAYTQKGEGWLNNATADLVKMGWTSYIYGASDYFVQNASFVKCDNITLGYNFENLFKGQKYQGISGRLAFSVSNVFYITKYKGLDPEQTSGAESSLYPRPRTYMVNLNLNF
jgi:iron complex outermembrane receptor protein